MRAVVLIGVLLFAMVSCGDQNGSSAKADQEVSKDIQSNEERQSEIQEMEKEISGAIKTERTSVLDAKADLLLKRYRDYITLNPRDSITSEYLFRAADLSVGMGKYDAAIAYIDRLHKDFTKFRKSVEMHLFKGFIYETYLNDHAKAVSAYTKLIEKYPNHRLASDARASIDNLTLSEEELIEKFKKMNADKDG